MACPASNRAATPHRRSQSAARWYRFAPRQATGAGASGSGPARGYPGRTTDAIPLTVIVIVVVIIIVIGLVKIDGDATVAAPAQQRADGRRAARTGVVIEADGDIGRHLMNKDEVAPLIGRDRMRTRRL